MNAFDIAAILAAIAATSGYINHRVLRLPASSGTLVVALVSSLAVLLIDYATGLKLADAAVTFLSSIDFNETLMHGMLSFLLFAGALHVDLEGLLANKWTIGTLATVGVLVSTTIVGVVTWWAFRLVGVPTPLLMCVAFGALISPTDPVAVMGLLKELRAPADLEAQIAGESLFNDGIGVVVFFAVMSLAGWSTIEPAHPVGGITLLTFFLREVAGGAALGVAVGYAGYRALKSLDERSLELLITLALAMFLYSLSFWLHVSGPIAVVVAGLLIGNPGRRFAMSERTREHIDAFWSMVDEILNAVLFLLLGLELLTFTAERHVIGAALLAIPITLLARLVSVAAPVSAMSFRGRAVRGLIPILTWSGLRGGISVAMALSLPHGPARELVLAATYAVVVFSILVQGLTVRKVLVYYRISEPPRIPGRTR
jgi:CPA1 family monovalent cation:H+ antiporter